MNNLATQNILVVDDTPIAISELVDTLRDDYSLSIATDGIEALECVKQETLPDLILLDIMMPGINGYEVLRRLKKNKQTKDIPVVFITVMDEVESETKGLGLGAVDYIIKPFSLSIVKARIDTHLKLKRYQDKLEELVKLRTIELTATNKKLKQKIHDYEQAEKTAQTSEAKYQDLYNNAPDMYISVETKTGKIIKCNQRTILNLGYKEEELIGRTIFDFLTPKSTESARKKISLMTIKNGIINGEELEVQHKNGTTIDVSMNARAVHDEKGNISFIISSWRDISEKKRLESQLHQTQRLETIGAIAGGIAHDFNNILSIIIGFTELAINDTKTSDSLKEDLREVLTAGGRGKDLVQQILTFSRQTDKKFKPVKVKIIIEEVINFLKSSLPGKIEIKTDIRSNSLISGDPSQIHQILMNLCTNAEHAMQKKGGILKVELNDVHFDTAQSLFINLKPGQYLNLTISDQGHGMPPETLAKLYDPFFTTKKKEEGTGLGMSVVHGIIKNHQGAIKVESQLKKGSTFNIYLPIIKKQKSGEVEIKSSTPVGTERILLIDDDPDLVRMNKRILEPLGYKIETRVSSIEALELFRTDPNRFDLIITDMAMPNMTGEELAQKLLLIRADIPIIICTGFSDNMNKEKARNMGFKAFLHKPILKQKLAETIRKVMD
ncbi:MAG: response regulator [Desulfobacteraceae bacterium]|nr:response regulator [Desulfobacteraceae bacterium]